MPAGTETPVAMNFLADVDPAAKDVPYYG